jgi:hypothetical protein
MSNIEQKTEEYNIEVLLNSVKAFNEKQMYPECPEHLQIHRDTIKKLCPEHSRININTDKKLTCINKLLSIQQVKITPDYTIPISDHFRNESLKYQELNNQSKTCGPYKPSDKMDELLIELNIITDLLVTSLKTPILYEALELWKKQFIQQNTSYDVKRDEINVEELSEEKYREIVISMDSYQYALYNNFRTKNAHLELNIEELQTKMLLPQSIVDAIAEIDRSCVISPHGYLVYPPEMKEILIKYGVNERREIDELIANLKRLTNFIDLSEPTCVTKKH